MSLPLLGAALIAAGQATLPANETAPAAYAPPVMLVQAAPAAAAQAPLDPATPPPVVPTLGQAPASVPPSTPTAADQVAGDQNAIVVTGRESIPGDPLEQLNADSFKAVQAVDDAVVGPVAKAYKEGLPSPVRKGLRNFLNNLEEPFIFANFLLQLKIGKAFETLGRFTVNTTLGFAGVFDVAKKQPFNLPYRPNGFADTLGFYGVGPGPYFYLPLVGPTTLRDLIGDGIDRLLLPFAVGKPFNDPKFVIPATLLGQLDDRAEFEETHEQIRNSPDPYAASRDLYLKSRQDEIDALRGRPIAPPPVVPTLKQTPAAAAPVAEAAPTPAPASAQPAVTAPAVIPQPETAPQP